MGSRLYGRVVAAAASTAVLGLVLLLTGTTASASDPVPPPEAPTCTGAPQLITAPTVSETRGVAGGTLTTSNGVWSTAVCPPTDYGYKWFRDGTTQISGALAQSYSPTSADVEHTLSAQVSGCNAYGCSAFYSDSNSSAIYESALGLRRQYTADAEISVEDQESLQVDVADGNLVLQASDFSLPGVADFGYQFTRSYNSLNNGRASNLSTLSNPTLAPGWEDVPDLAFFTNGDARYAGDGGYEITFTKSGSSYVSPPGSDATLVQQGDGTFLLTFYKTGMKEKFSSSGQLLNEIDQNGNTIAFSWSGTQLATVTDTTGRTVTFNYTSGRVTSITAPGNCTGGTCTYSYTYDANGRLSTFRDPLNATTTYGYNGAGLLSTVKNPLNNEWSITYDGQDRVRAITGGLNSSGACPPSPAICPVTSFTYAAAPSGLCSMGMETDVTDPSNYVTSYCSDGRARVSQVKDALANTSFADYTDTLFGGSNCVDANGVTLDDQPCATVDGLNKTTKYGYDSSGRNLVWEQNPVQTSSQRSSWAYTDASHPYYPTSFTDADGNRTNYVYDSTSGNLTSSTSGLNSAGGCPSGTVCPRTDHIYSSNGALQADKLGLDSTDSCASNTPQCSRTDYTYYTSNTSNGTIGDLASETTGLNLSDSCPTGATCPKTTYFYDAAGNQTSQVDPLGNVSGGNPANYTQSSTYDNDGRPLSEKDEDGNTTYYSYDAAGNQTTVKDANSYLTCDVYDANNRLTSEQDGLASTSICSSSLTCPASSVCPKTSYVYYANGDLQTETDPRGNATGYVYDGDHELTSETDPLSNTTSYGYDADGNQILMIEPRGYETKYGYNAIGQLTSEQSGLNSSGVCPASPAICPLTTNHYDLAGNEDYSQDPYGRQTNYGYDADNRLTSVQSGLMYDPVTQTYHCLSGDICPTTNYGYDAESNTSSVTTPGDPTRHETSYSYDPNGNELSERSGLDASGSCPSGATCPTTSFAYDANGNLATKTVPAAAGHAIIYGDDHAGQLTSITYPSGYSTPNVSFTYDADGNTKTMTDGAGIATYTYNNLDQITNETRGSGTAFTYTYDLNGNVTARQYPDSSWRYYAYDTGDELCLASTSSTAGCGSNPSGVAYTAYTYNAAGNVKTTKPVNSAGAVIETETRTYNSADFLTDIKTTNNPGTGTFAEVAYTLDNMGMPTTIARTGTVATGGSTVNCTVDDTYDNNEQISSAFYHANCPSGGITYTYTWDADGNRTKLVNGGTTTNYAYNNLDQLCAKSSGTPSCGSPNYTYNANGDEISDTGSGNTYSYSYDLENRLLSASNNGATTTYTHDGQGNMLTATASGVTTSFLWDPNSDGDPQLALTRNGTLGGGTTIHRYLYGADRISETDSGQTYYYTYDGLGSTVNLVNASSASQYAYVYNTFGANRITYQGGAPPPQGNEMKFIAQRLDPATGNNLNLYDTTVRNLDTSTGRFLSQDPTASTTDTAGSYLYANNNPDTYADPSGTAATSPLASAPDGSGSGGSREERLIHKLERTSVNGIRIIHPRITVRAAKRARMPIALACAELSVESCGGYNVWGADSTIFIRGHDVAGNRYWGRRIPCNQSRQVTKAGYLAYKRQRGRTGRGGMQGVGPMQLTWYSLQNEADRMGGSWRLSPNMFVGFRTIVNNHRGESWYNAIEAYNSGNPDYANTVLRWERKWARVLRVRSIQG